ncbi:MAG: HNH endonuclease [Oscillospiraceae bacterium]|nr:HNH endonuclease [Oscillospiraceae bacterium]
MPRKALRTCRHSGCPNLTDELYCTEHKPMHPDRPSATKRGYGSKWQRISKAYLHKHPMCVICKSQGRFVSATVVDHIIPHRGNQTLMWSDTNWQALCKPCHDRKTGNEDSRPEYFY